MLLKFGNTPLHSPVGVAFVVPRVIIALTSVFCVATAVFVVIPVVLIQVAITTVRACESDRIFSILSHSVLNIYISGACVLVFPKAVANMNMIYKKIHFHKRRLSTQNITL